MLRPLRPDDVIELKKDPYMTSGSCRIQTHGPFTIVVAPFMGAVTVQVNNGNMYSRRYDYGIGQSYNAMHQSSPVINTSFTSYWANTTYTAASGSTYQFISCPIQARYMKLSGTGLTGTGVFGHVYARPRV